MMASELIRALQQIVSKYGDLDVVRPELDEDTGCVSFYDSDLTVKVEGPDQNTANDAELDEDTIIIY